MSKNNKFGFGPLETPQEPKRDRSVGPMGAAVRDAAESLQEATEAKVEQRRRNAQDARAFRDAQDEGRVLEALPLDEVLTDDLPRDRIDLEEVAAADEMEELKSSIRERGQKEPIEVYRDGAGGLQLKKGWRRLTALRQLHGETGDARFATVLARVDEGEDGRLLHYIDMVEENVIRQDLTFAEMAQVVIQAMQDGGVEEINSDDLVLRIYGSLHKMKRSYIRHFVFLLTQLGDGLQWPKEVARNLGVDVARAIKSADQADELKAALLTCKSAEEQNAVLKQFVAGAKVEPRAQPKKPAKEKRELRVGKTKVTVRNGEVRLMGEMDYTHADTERLQRAVKAFEAEMKRPTVRQF